MTFLPSSKSMIGYKVSGSDLLAVPVSAALAFLIKPFDGQHVVGLTDMILYTSLSAGFAELFFIVFREAQGLPNYFSVLDALRIAKATLCIIVSTTAVAIVVLRIDPQPLSIPVVQFLLLIVMLSIARVAQRLLAHRRTLTGMAGHPGGPPRACPPLSSDPRRYRWPRPSRGTRLGPHELAELLRSVA
jgi:FlaA1/EpsC-like NDP-sugar epimerase